MSDGIGIRTRGNQLLKTWLLVVAVGLGVVSLGGVLLGRIEGSAGSSSVGTVSRPALVEERSGEGSGIAESNRTPIRVEIERRRDANYGCPSGDRMPIAVMITCH